MIKRTLFFGNPAYLSTRLEQLVVAFPAEMEKEVQTVPIEDIGFIVLEHPQITITQGLMMKLLQNKAAVITCDASHMPNGYLQPLVGHTEQTERIRYQLEASLPLKKQLWQQTIVAKVNNQASHLVQQGFPAKKLKRWADEVKSGDVGNLEAVAAAYYFQELFSELEFFSRDQHGDPPNNLLNYGYAILRAITARALVSTGLLTSVGIFHRNKYNPFCLADDVMEPYRPYVDALVYDMIEEGYDYQFLTQEIKTILLQLPVLDVWIDGKKSPLMVAMSRTSNSLYECFAGLSRKILYPQLT